MSRKISEGLRTLAGVAPQDITTLRTGAFVSVAGAGRLLAAITTGSVAATKKVTAQFRQATDAAGTGAKNLGDPVEVIAPSGGAALTFAADANVERLDNGFSFVAVALSSDNATAVTGSAVLLLGNNRFNP